MATTSIRKRGAGNKKPVKAIGPRTAKHVDMKWYGEEPKFAAGDLLEDNDVRLQRAYNWYNYFYTVTEAKKWAVDWHNEISPSVAKILNKVPEGMFSTTAGWLCRMASRGAILPDQSLAFLKKKITEMTEFAQVSAEEKTIAKAVVKRYAEPGYAPLIALVEERLDDLYTSGYTKTFDCYDYMSSQDVKKSYAKAVSDYYRPLFDEIKLLCTKKDKDLNEAYSHLSKKQIDTYLKQLFSIVDDADRWSANKTKISRTVRTPKKKSSEQLLKNFKWMKELPALKVVSIDPASIIGATTLIAYNHKYKKLMIYSAMEGQTLSIKGASIINYDETTVAGKTLRKPETQLQVFTTGTLTFMKKRFEEISSKPSVPSSRINEEIILLKVFK